VQIGQQFADLYTERYWHTKAFDTIDRLAKIASELAASLATLSVAWVLASPAITSAILGASRPAQLTDTLAAADLDLPDDAKVALDDLTHEYRWATLPDRQPAQRHWSRLLRQDLRRRCGLPSRAGWLQE